MPACAPDGTPAGQRRLRETGCGAKTGQEQAPRVRAPVVSRISEANRAFCSPSLGGVGSKTDIVHCQPENVIPVVDRRPRARE